MPLNPYLHDAMQILRRTLPEAARILQLDLGDAFAHWIRTVDQKLLPRLNTNHPLTVAICGGGSAGKSTLFNAMVGKPVSPVGGQAGLNRRVLVAAQEKLLKTEGYLKHLGHAFDTLPEPLEDANQLLEPGVPLYCAGNQLPGNVILLDTPDIDTGAQGLYSNRDAARQALETADLFIYLFTNATYNNRDNTDFIARMLTGMGARPCYLVYRVYSGFTHEEVQAHALTVAENLYGSQAKDQVLGLFRMDEDNAVAAGEKAVAPKPVYGAKHSIPDTLAALDIRSVRAGLVNSMTEDVLKHARGYITTLHQTALELKNYKDALAAAQVRAVQQVLSHFPADRVLRRFARIWMETDPTHIKWMRATGRVVGWPVKAATRTIRHLGSSDKNEPPAIVDDAADSQVEMDLLGAANQLYQKSMEGHLILEGDHVPLPALLTSTQKQLGHQPWKETLDDIISHKAQILSWSRQLDTELGALANELRQRMSLFDQVRQTFAAMLNVIPATAAVTYILHTGDPVGATGIKIKLTGFLGLHDLYALVAIPATAGVSKADRRQLEQLLHPLAQTWLEHKFNEVQQLFERRITGPLMKTAQTAQDKLTPLLEEIEKALALIDS